MALYRNARSVLVIDPDGTVRLWKTDKRCPWPPVPPSSPFEPAPPCELFLRDLTGRHIDMASAPFDADQKYIAWTLYADDWPGGKYNAIATQLVHKGNAAHARHGFAVYGTCVLAATMCYVLAGTSIGKCFGCPAHLYADDLERLLRVDDPRAVGARRAMHLSRCANHDFV